LEKTESSGHDDNRILIENELSHLKNWNFYSKIGITVLASVFVVLLMYRMYMGASSLNSNSYISSNSAKFAIKTGNNRTNNTINNSKKNNTSANATTA